MNAPTFPRAGFPATRIQAWLLDDERRMLAAICCADVRVGVDVRAWLAEYRGQSRLPGSKRLTEEQRARHEAAGFHVGPAFKLHMDSTLGDLFLRLAQARGFVAPADRGDS